MKHADFVVNALYHNVDYDRKNYFFGSKYVLLRDDYLRKSSDPSEDVSRIMMTFGGMIPRIFRRK